MLPPPIDVNAKGAIILGSEVTCDGFVYGAPFRVQTHIHTDHMADFLTSKGYQDILMSKATRDLLIADYGADLPFRQNIKGLSLNEPVKMEGPQIHLSSSGHMLGAVQVQVTCSDGLRLGYSSDFKWPLDNVIQVDALVVDSTYGSPDRRRYYTQADVNERFVELVMSKLRHEPVIIYGFRGTLERALTLLNGEINCPVVASHRCNRELDVYRRYGYVMADFISSVTSAGQYALQQPRYIRVVRKGEELPDAEATVITLSAFMSDPRDPVIEYSNRSYSVAMTDHADFDGTLEYVRATGARYVVTDNTRGGHAVDLAAEIRNRLNVEARPSSNAFSREWGS